MALLPSGINWSKTLTLTKFSLMDIGKYQEKCPKKTDIKGYQFFLENYLLYIKFNYLLYINYLYI